MATQPAGQDTRQGAKKGLLHTVFGWASARTHALTHSAEWTDTCKLASDTWDAMIGNTLLRDMGLEDKATSFGRMLPYTALATFGFALADGGTTSVWGPALFFLVSQFAAGHANALNEVRRHKGISFPDPTGLLGKKAQGVLKSAFNACTSRLEAAFDYCSGNDRLAARGIEKLSFAEISPYARAATTGFALGMVASFGLVGAVPLVLGFYALSATAMAQGYTSLQSFRHDQKNPPAPTPPQDQPASP